jgi:hypothetical protein
MLRQEQEKKEEEFQEADILWPADAAQDLELGHMYYSRDGDDDEGEEYYGERRRLPTTPPYWQQASSPIDIPRKSGRAAAGAKALAGFSNFSASLAGAGGSSLTTIGSHVFVPPHVIVDRRAKRAKVMLMLDDVPKGRVRPRAMAMLE